MQRILRVGEDLERRGVVPCSGLVSVDRVGLASRLH